MRPVCFSTRVKKGDDGGLKMHAVCVCVCVCVSTLCTIPERYLFQTAVTVKMVSRTRRVRERMELTHHAPQRSSTSSRKRPACKHTVHAHTHTSSLKGCVCVCEGVGGLVGNKFGLDVMSN